MFAEVGEQKEPMDANVVLHHAEEEVEVKPGGRNETVMCCIISLNSSRLR